MAETVAVGSQNQYSNAVSGGTVPSDLFVRDVPDWMDKQLRTDVPLTKSMGTASAPSNPMNKAEWGWGSPDPYQDTLAVAITSTSATTFTATAGEYYQVGSLILIDDEEMRVTGVAGDTVTVTRGFAGTTAATHLISSAIFIMAPAVAESADDADSPYTLGEVDFNYHQIMTFTWSLSKRADVTGTYENPNGNRFQAQLRRKMEDTAPVRFELAMLLGRRALGTGSSPSAFGGLREPTYITTRTSVSGVLTETDLMSGLQTVSNLVGPSLMPSEIHASPFTCRIISSWYNESRRTSGSDEKINVKFTTIDTPFGVIKVVPNYLMSTVANNKLYVIDPKMLKRRPYATGTGWQTGEHSTQGWHRRGYLRADMTVLAEGCDSRLELYGFSTTAGDYAGLS